MYKLIRAPKRSPNPYDLIPACGKCTHWERNKGGRNVGFCDALNPGVKTLRLASSGEICSSYHAGVSQQYLEGELCL